MSNAWIQTVRGGAFDLLEPSKSKVILEEVAYALGNLCRFTGHTDRFYSVAEHSCRVAARCLALAYGRDLPEIEARRWMLAGLLHDAAEAYTGDVSYPMKLALMKHKSAHEARVLFQDIEAHVAKSLGDPALEDSEIAKGVKRADLELLKWESDRLLRGGRTGEWPTLNGVLDVDSDADIVAVIDWPALFLRTYKALTSNSVIPFCYAPQYMKRIVRAVFADGKVTRWFEPTSCGLQSLADANEIVVDESRVIVRMEYQ